MGGAELSFGKIKFIIQFPCCKVASMVTLTSSLSKKETKGSHGP